MRTPRGAGGVKDGEVTLMTGLTGVTGGERPLHRTALAEAHWSVSSLFWPETIRASFTASRFVRQ